MPSAELGPGLHLWSTSCTPGPVRKAPPAAPFCGGIRKLRPHHPHFTAGQPPASSARGWEALGCSLALSGAQSHLQSNGSGPCPLADWKPFSCPHRGRRVCESGASPGALEQGCTRWPLWVASALLCPRPGPTDGPGQVAAGWTSLFPASLCNQVMQGQLT